MILSKILKKIKQRNEQFKKHPLTKNSRFSAMMRYFSFNASQRMYPKRRIYNWIDGLKFYAEKGDAGIVPNIYFKIFDYEESMFLLKRLKKDDLFVDVGANVGHFSLLAAGISKAKVIAIEPIPSTHKKLMDNIAINKLSSKVDCINCGVGEQNGALHFIKNNTVMNRVALSNEKDTIEVAVHTLDDLLADKNPVFIKIDVEGFEYPVLKGALNVMNNSSLKYLMIEFNNSGEKFGYSDKDVFDLITKNSFVPVTYQVDSDSFTFNNSYNTHKFNTLFVRKETS